MQPEDYQNSLITSVKLQNTKLTQKQVAFLYTNNERSEREIKETISFTITLKRVQYVGISLSKEAKHLYSEYNKMLMRETEGDTNR